MSEIDRQALGAINRLLRINNASEKGFNLAAQNVKNRGLKLILKSFAQDRADFGEQLRQMALTTGSEPAAGSGWLAASHRGWINIKTAMTIGQAATEAVVLAEVSRGERSARRTYERALATALPPELEALAQQQYERLLETGRRIRQLRGADGNRTVVRLFDSEEDARTAIAALAQAGFAMEVMEQVPVDEAVVAYKTQEAGSTRMESALAGALLGAVVGLALGVVAMASAALAGGSPLFGLAFLETALLILLSALSAGLLLGALIGAIIGVGIVQDDAYRYNDSLAHGSLLLMVRTAERDADKASATMHAVNARRRPQTAAA